MTEVWSEPTEVERDGRALTYLVEAIRLLVGHTLSQRFEGHPDTLCVGDLKDAGYERSQRFSDSGAYWPTCRLGDAYSGSEV